MQQKWIALFIIVVITLFIQGCGGYHVRFYSGPELDKSQISVITTDDKFLTIVGIDGEKTIKSSNTLDFTSAVFWGRFPRTVSLLPGQHKALICYDHILNICADDWLSIETEAGKTYIVKYSFYDIGSKKTIKVWSYVSTQ